MMFKPLSFKKLGRRIRSPFSLFKKRGKRASNSRKTDRSPNPDSEEVLKKDNLKEPTTTREHTSTEPNATPTPGLDIIIPQLSTPASSQLDTPFPSTPAPLSSEFADYARIQEVEPTLQDLVIGYGGALEFSTLIEEPPAAPKKTPAVIELPTSSVTPKTADTLPPSSADNTNPIVEVPSLIEETAKTADADAVNMPKMTDEPSDEVETPRQEAPLAVEALDEETLDIDEDPPIDERVVAVVPETVSEEMTSAPVEAVVSPEPPVINTALVPVITATPEATETPIISVLVVPMDEEDPEIKQISSNIAISESPIAMTSSLDFPAAKQDSAIGTSASVKTPPSPRTPKSKSLSVTTPPRNRIGSGSASPSPKKSDTEIMANIQASVRAREKKRLAKEAEEKERVLREIKLAAEREKGVTEDEKTNPGEKDDVLSEVRSWRKQREDSLKGAHEVAKTTAAKTAAYRAASNGEEIMSELLNNVQTRSTRSPVFEDPRAKREQLLLEEVFSNRVSAVQG